MSKSKPPSPVTEAVADGPDDELPGLMYVPLQPGEWTTCRASQKYNRTKHSVSTYLRAEMEAGRMTRRWTRDENGRPAWAYRKVKP